MQQDYITRIAKGEPHRKHDLTGFSLVTAEPSEDANEASLSIEFVCLAAGTVYAVRLSQWTS